MLETVWFLLWGVLWAVYFALDGYDLGLGAMMPILARNERDRRAAFNAIGPFWDGNEVWLITAGGVTFAAFPTVYATMFSSLYTPLMLVLFALIFRAVSLEFHHQFESRAWRRVWAACFVVGSILPAVLLGVAFANIFRGLMLDDQGVLQGGLVSLLNPYGLLGGLLFLIMFAVHGTIWLVLKSDGALRTRAAAVAKGGWVALTVVAVAFLVATAFATRLYDNYLDCPVLFLIPLLAVAALMLTRVFLARGAWWRAWAASSGLIVSATLFGVVGLYPNMFPSRLDPSLTLTAYNASSSPLTLKIMLGVALVFVPIVIAYQTWVHVAFRRPLADDEVGYE